MSASDHTALIVAFVGIGGTLAATGLTQGFQLWTSRRRSDLEERRRAQDREDELAKERRAVQRDTYHQVAARLNSLRARLVTYAFERREARLAISEQSAAWLLEIEAIRDAGSLVVTDQIQNGFALVFKMIADIRTRVTHDEISMNRVGLADAGYAYIVGSMNESADVFCARQIFELSHLLKLLVLCIRIETNDASGDRPGVSFEIVSLDESHNC